MSKIEPFNEHSKEYDDWYSKNAFIYLSELNAIKSFIPQELNGLEVGVGTGRFAEPLNIRVGIEPSENMAAIARNHGIQTIRGSAECIPFPDRSFDFALMVTAICFFDDVNVAFQEAFRVIKGGGFLVVAFIDRNSELGIMYEKLKNNSLFYKDATFFFVQNVTDMLTQAGFSEFEYKQTIYSVENIMHEVKDGYGEGGFVVIKACRKLSEGL